MAGGAKYSAKHEAAILALLESATIEAAAAKASISCATMTRWLARSDFQAAYSAARRRAFEASLSRLQTLTGKATDALRRALNCGKTASEIRAAGLILEHAAQAALLIEFSDRLRVLEQRKIEEMP